jgi:hypothetical protein
VEAEERIRTTPDQPEPASGPQRDRPTSADHASNTVAHERCVHHPGRAAVVRCSSCEEPICLACAVPVRSRAIGPECLAAELGDPALTIPREPRRAVAGSTAAVAGAVLAVLATLGPWTRTGAGDRLLGAWVPSVRWSMVAVSTAVVLAVSAWWFRSRGSRAAAAVVILAGTAVASSSVLAITFPPTFQVASWGPWLAVVGGTIAVAGAIVSTVSERRPGQGV